MKCNEIDFIRYVEGHTSTEMENHLAECRVCREDMARFSMFINEVMPVYREGKKQEAALDRQLAAMDPASMRPLPAGIAEKVQAMKKESLVAQLKNIIGENRANTRELIESILHPQIEALPASPKDITGSRIGKPKRKKATTGRSQSKKQKE